MCSPSVASRAQAPAARTSNISRHSAGSTRIPSKLSIGCTWIALLALPILGGRPNIRSPHAATAAYKVAKPQAHLPQRLSTLVLPSTASYRRQSLRILTPQGRLLAPAARPLIETLKVCLLGQPFRGCFLLEPHGDAGRERVHGLAVPNSQALGCALAIRSFRYHT